MPVDQNTLVLLIPELILLVIAAWIYIGGTLTRSRTWWSVFALATYGAAAFVMFRNEATLFDTVAPGSVIGPLLLDLLGQNCRQLALLIGALFTLLAMRTAPQRLASEVIATLMLMVVGLMLVARANDLVLLFVGLELISIPTYVLLMLGRRERQTAEATMKYFFLSILSSALLLYGFSFLYGLAGTTVIVSNGSVEGIRDSLSQVFTDQQLYQALANALKGQPQTSESTLLLLPVTVALVFGGLSFKIAAVPFQFYAPDVYQGSSNLNAGLLAVVPKVAGIVVLVRLLIVAMPAGANVAWLITMMVAVLTMTIGNVSALWQTNVRRLMAYSSIAHAGYMLIGLAVALTPGQPGGYSGVSAMLLYLLVYVVASVGTFSVLNYLSSSQRELNTVEELAGLGYQRPAAAAAMAIFMFSLAGIPPLAGFWGKLTLFQGAISAIAQGHVHSLALLGLAVVGVLNAAIAAAYYLRVVAVMYFRKPPADQPVIRGESGPAALAWSLSAAIVVTIGLLPGRVVDDANQIGQSLPKPVPAVKLSAKPK